MEIRRELEKIVVDNLDNDALFLVNIEISENKGPKKVRVLVDSDEGLSIDQCAALSRKIGQVIEEKELIENAFHPGSLFSRSGLSVKIQETVLEKYW